MESPRSELDREVAAEATRFGLRPLYDRPKHLIPLEGSRFAGVITDGAVTPSDLTEIANWKDQRIRDVYTLDNPKLIVQIEEVEFRFVVNGESETILFDLMNEVYVHWKHDGIDWWMSVAKFAGMFGDAYAVSTTETATRLVHTHVKALRFTLPEPWLIDMENDTFEVAPRTLVNTGANVKFALDVFGAAWPTRYGIPNRRSCPVDEKLAKELNKERAAYRLRGGVFLPLSR